MASKGWSRIAWVVLLTLITIYVVKLGGLALETHRAGQAADGMQREVDRLEQEVRALETAAVEAESDDYVERWARDRRDLAREGDRVIVPVAEDPAGRSEPEPAAAVEEASTWERFMGWLRGDDAAAGGEEAQPPDKDGDGSGGAADEDAPRSP